MSALRRQSALADIRRGIAKLRKAGDGKLAAVVEAVVDNYGLVALDSVEEGRIAAGSWRDVRLRVDTNGEPAALEYGLARGRRHRLAPVPREVLRALLACEGKPSVRTSDVKKTDAHALRALLTRLFSAPGDPLKPDRAGRYFIGWRWREEPRRREVPMTDVGGGASADDLDVRDEPGAVKHGVRSARSRRCRPEESA